MSRIYSDNVVIVDLDYVVAAQLTCRGGHWMIDLMLGLGSEGQTMTCAYPSESEAQRAFLGMRSRLEDEAEGATPDERRP